MDTFAACWEAHAKDVTCMGKLLATDFSAVIRSGRAVDRAAFIDRAAQLPDTNTWAWPRDKAVIRFYGTTALVMYAIADPSPEPHEDQFTHVFVNDGQGWRMARLHISHPFAPQGKK